MMIQIMCLKTVNINNVCGERERGERERERERERDLNETVSHAFSVHTYIPLLYS